MSIAVVAGSLAVITGITLPIVLAKKKKAKLAADYEATAVKKPKIDTTDDKSIDVYAKDEAPDAEENEAEEAAEEEAVEAEEQSASDEEKKDE
ncbi:MAG: hypothetical protein ACI4SH_00240 [Candidatus Scatosoma sp.]